MLRKYFENTIHQNIQIFQYWTNHLTNPRKFAECAKPKLFINKDEQTFYSKQWANLRIRKKNDYNHDENSTLYSVKIRTHFSRPTSSRGKRRKIFEPHTNRQFSKQLYCFVIASCIRLINVCIFRMRLTHCRINLWIRYVYLNLFVAYIYNSFSRRYLGSTNSRIGVGVFGRIQLKIWDV